MSSYRVAPQLLSLVNVELLIKSFFKRLQPEKADSSILVTLSGMVMLVSPEQPERALLPILVTPSGMVMFVSPEQFSNA